MALISLRQLLDHAAEHQYGVPAFNVNNLEQTRAIMEAADATDSPVIMQASAGARKYAGAPFLKAMMDAAMAEFPHIPVCVHQDHGTSPGVCQRSIQLGFSSVMMDGSLGEDGKTPMDYDYNARIIGGLVILLFALPLVGLNSFYLHLFIMIFMHAVMAQSWNVIAGFSGQISLGHGAFFGIGAYATSFFYMEYGITPWISIFFGMFISGVFAVLIGIPMLRLSGHYFAIATLLIGISFQVVFQRCIVDL